MRFSQAVCKICHQSAYLTILSLAVTLTFDLLTSKRNQLILSPQCIKIWKFGEIPIQAVCNRANKLFIYKIMDLRKHVQTGEE